MSWRATRRAPGRQWRDDDALGSTPRFLLGSGTLSSRNLSVLLTFLRSDPLSFPSQLRHRMERSDVLRATRLLAAYELIRCYTCGPCTRCPHPIRCSMLTSTRCAVSDILDSFAHLSGNTVGVRTVLHIGVNPRAGVMSRNVTSPSAGNLIPPSVLLNPHCIPGSPPVSFPGPAITDFYDISAVFFPE